MSEGDFFKGEMDFFFELFGDLPKQGPGSRESSLRALHAIPNYKDAKYILDAGCGTGRHTILLAEETSAAITALDHFDQQIEALKKNIGKSDFSDRIEVVQGSMDDLSFSKNKYDLIWSESSIYNVGFEKGLRCWRDYLEDGGCVAVSEAVWFTENPSEEIKAFWDKMYPDVHMVEKVIERIGGCGYRLLDYFLMPKSDWWDGFYDILEARVATYSEKELRPGVKEILQGVKEEIELFKKYNDEYGYAFFIGQKGS